MKYLSAQPDSDYFIWQLMVQVNNFRKYNLEQHMIILIGYSEEHGINPYALRFKQSTTAKVFFIPDDRIDQSYAPSIQPHLIKKFLDLITITDDVFYTDSDVLFIKQPVLDNLTEHKVYLSDTVSYIGAKYIRSKGEQLLTEMCAVVGIDRDKVIANESCSGGAQHLFKKGMIETLDWDKIESDSNALYKLMVDSTSIYNPQHPIQYWTAGMWALLWNIWLGGLKTEVTSVMDFKFPTDKKDTIQHQFILHNAGVMPDQKHLFCKGDYVKASPFEASIAVDDGYCSALYVDEITETAKGIY